MMFDVARARAAFPALADGFAYFDNAGGSLVLADVADRVRDYLLTTSVQTGASYAHSRRASERVAEARSKLALMVGARRSEEVWIGPTTTALCQWLARALLGKLKPGDEVIVTVFDHESNIGAWRWLERFGIVLREWSIDRDSFEIDLADLDDLLSERTRLVAVTHASNILGTINPIAEIARRVHAAGAEIVVDAVAYAPHRAVDVQALDVDYYVFSFYKTYGPHLAVMVGKHDKLIELDGLYHYFYDREKVPAKLEPGNLNYELTWGAAGIVTYLDRLGGGTGDRAAIERAFDGIAAHEAALAERFLAFLGSRNDVRVVGRTTSDVEARVPTIAFKPAFGEASEIVARVDAANIGIRHGDFHSRRLVEHLGLADRGGVLRVSMVHYNTLEEVDRLIAALDAAL